MLDFSAVIQMDYLKKYNKKFYKTKSWKDKRKEILQRDNFECQLCKHKGRYSKATTVHHKKHYDKFPQLALTDNNLISVCSICHNKLHPEKAERISKYRKDKQKIEIHKEKFE